MRGRVIDGKHLIEHAERVFRVVTAVSSSAHVGKPPKLVRQTRAESSVLERSLCERITEQHDGFPVRASLIHDANGGRLLFLPDGSVVLDFMPSLRRRARPTVRDRSSPSRARVTVTAVASPRLLSILLASSQTRFTQFAKASAFVSRARVHVRVPLRFVLAPTAALPSSDASVHSSIAVRIAPVRARAREPAKRRARPTPLARAQLPRRLPLASVVRSSRGRGLRADADFANHRRATDRLASSRVVARSSDDRAREFERGVTMTTHGGARASLRARARETIATRLLGRATSSRRRLVSSRVVVVVVVVVVHACTFVRRKDDFDDEGDGGGGRRRGRHRG